MRGAARGDLSHVVNLTAVFKFSKLLFRETVVTFGLAMLSMLRCNTSDASASFFSWQARYFFQKLLTSVNDNSEVQCCFGRRVSLSWRGASLIALAQPYRHFVRVRSLSLWRDAHFDIAHAALNRHFAGWIALVARCSF